MADNGAQASHNNKQIPGLTVFLLAFLLKGGPISRYNFTLYLS